MLVSRGSFQSEYGLIVDAIAPVCGCVPDIAAPIADHPSLPTGSSASSDDPSVAPTVSPSAYCVSVGVTLSLPPIPTKSMEPPGSPSLAPSIRFTSTLSVAPPEAPTALPSIVPTDPPSNPPSVTPTVSPSLKPRMPPFSQTYRQSIISAYEQWWQERW